MLNLFAYHNGISQQVLKFVSESQHKVRITLDRCPSFEYWKGVTSKRDVFIISPPPLICVCKARIFVNLFCRPSWERDTENPNGTISKKNMQQKIKDTLWHHEKKVEATHPLITDQMHGTNICKLYPLINHTIGLISEKQQFFQEYGQHLC